MSRSDEQLIAAFRTGDTRAFEQLVGRYEKPLWSFLRRFVSDRTTVEDLMQEVFLRVVKNAGEFQGTSKFSTWLFAIARNLCIDHSRRAVHRKTTSLDSPLRSDGPTSETLHDRVESRDLDAEMQSTGKQIRGRVDRAVARLPDEQREVFLMREVAGLSFAEIASTVGTTESTVKSRMRYALEKLREELSDYRETEANAPASDYK